MMEEDMGDVPPNYNIQPMMGGSGHASEGNLRFQLEAEFAVTKILNQIKGVRVECDLEGNEIEKQVSEPKLNRKGVAMVEGYLSAFLDNIKTFALTELSEDYIFDEVRSVGHDIVAALQDNWNEYEVKSITDASFIVRIVTSNVFAVLCKGKNLNFMKYLSKTVQAVEHTQFQPQQFNQQPQRDKSMFSFLPFIKK